MVRNFAVLLAAMCCVSTKPLAPHQADTADTLRAIYGSQYSANLMDRASLLYRQHRLVESLALYGQGFQDASHRKHPLAAFWFLIGRAGANYASLQYRQALDDYLAARDTALKAGLQSQAAIALSNLSSLYFHSFDTTSALAAAEDAIHLLPSDARPDQRAQVLEQLGRVLVARGESDRAVPIFEEAVRLAARSKNGAVTEAFAWDQMGEALIQAGKIPQAEYAIQKALRLRKKDDPDLFATEYKLGLVCLRKGDLRSARRLIESAFAKRGHDSLRVHLHGLYLAMAQILGAEGDLQGSLREYLLAAQAADEWRSRGLFADQFRISTDVLLDEIHDGAVDTAAALFLQTHDQKYAVLAWQFDEHIRSASLRESLKQGHGWTTRVSPDYWPMLDQLRALQGDQFTDSSVPGVANTSEIARLRMHLAEMEARAGAVESQERQTAPSGGTGATDVRSSTNSKLSEIFSPGISLNNVRKVLGNSRTLISFHQGHKLYRWVITKYAFELKVMKGIQTADIANLRTAIREGSSDAVSRGNLIYSDLFSSLSDSKNRNWSIALDGNLLDLPLAGLVSGRRDGRPVYLIEGKTVELIPGAWAIGNHSEASKAGGFVGIGDGIYNMADSRYRALASKGSSWPGSLPSLFANNPAPAELPRLVQSQREIVECARLVGGASTILLGANANRTELLSALARQPSFIHIATHFIADLDAEKTPAIALGIRPDAAGKPHWELLTADDIRSLQVPGAVVVMSGCSSAAGKIMPAAGLLGLARAWLEAGATAVIATQWPVPDNSGELFLKFYNHLRNSDCGDKVAPAEALQRAQIEMLRSSGSSSEPRIWAAYEISARSN